MSVLNGKWKMRLILCLASEPKHFNEIWKCHGISPRILSKELKELELNSILIRTELNDNLKSVVYSLTEQGVELVPIILQLQKWGTRYRKSILENQ
jgi:DNA-binding HxlR family transcriptional regulator